MSRAAPGRQGLDIYGNMRGRPRRVGDGRRPEGGATCSGFERGQKGAQVAAEAHNTIVDGHVHHWMLSEPSGGEVPGRCKGCGETREFPANPSNPYLRGLAKKRPTRRET